MSLKTLAMIRTEDDEIFGVQKWDDETATYSGYQDRPAFNKKWDGDQWRTIDGWEAGTENQTGIQSDTKVMKEALRRLQDLFDIDVEEIVYTNYSGQDMGVAGEV